MLKLWLTAELVETAMEEIQEEFTLMLTNTESQILLVNNTLLET